MVRSVAIENDERKSTMAKNYGDMTMNELIEDVIAQAIKGGCITYPMRAEGYHQASNLIYTDRLEKGDVVK